MIELEQIEKWVRKLNPQELSAFTEWFEALQAERWDRQFETDAANGKFDHFAEEALADFRTKKTIPL